MSCLASRANLAIRARGGVVGGGGGSELGTREIERDDVGKGSRA